jgi:hypothetical protein
MRHRGCPRDFIALIFELALTRGAVRTFISPLMVDPWGLLTSSNYKHQYYPRQFLKKFKKSLVRPRDGPGYVFVNGQLVRVPPRGPIMDIISAVAVVDLADSMSPEVRRRMRAMAFDVISEIAELQSARPKDRG